MAIAPLERRLDKITQTIDEQAERVETVAAQPVELEPLPAELPQEEPVQIAGIGSGIKTVLGKLRRPAAQAPAPAPVAPPVAPPPPAITPATQAVQDQQDAAKAAVSLGLGDQPTVGIVTKTEAAKRARPQVTPQAVVAERQDVMDLRATTPPELEKPPLTQFNLPQMDTAESVKSTVEAINNLLDIKVQTITFDEVRDAAVKAGMDKSFINQLTSGKLQVNPENTYRALNAMTASAAKLDGYMAKIANGTATDVEKAEAAQWVHFHSVLQESVKGYQTNVAQSLSVMRIPRTGTADLKAISDSLGTETDLVKFAQAYLDSGTPEGKAALINKLATGTPWEKAFTVYVNALLMGTGTMVKNTLSSLLFTPYRMAERGMAAGIGAARQAVGLGTEDVYRFSEVPAMLAATPQAVGDGWQLLKHAFTKGYPQDWLDPDKIARSQQRLELFKRGDPRFWKPEGSLLDAGIWGMNAAITLPGRTIMATDQFFKGLNYRFELVAEQTRAGLQAADAARLAGKSAAEIQKAADDAAEMLGMNPPEFLQEVAASSTFSQKVEGPLGEAMASLNPSSPLKFALRTQIPFISAPVNVMSAVLERTPLAVFSGNVRSALKMGGKEGDLALAKVGLASSAMYGMSTAATNGAITGSGPGDKGQREAMVRQGWQPYSIVIDVSGGLDEELRQTLSQFPGSIRYGSGDYRDKVFLSYQGLEPIGALMAISADYVDYVKYEQDDSRINAYVGGAAFGLANYIMEHPFLTGVGNIASLIGSGIPNSRQKIVETVNYLTQTATTVGLTVADPFFRPLRQVTQVTDPYQRDYQINPNAPAGMKGLLDGLNKWKAQTPGLSDELPPRLNIWSEPIEHEYAWSPLRLKEGKRRKSDQALIQLGVNVSMPGRNISGVDPDTQITGKTKLEAAEYNELLRIANQELKLEERVLEVVDAVKEDMLKDKKDLIFYQNAVGDVISKTFSQARQVMLDPANQSEMSRNIRERIAENAAKVKEFGKGAR